MSLALVYLQDLAEADIHFLVSKLVNKRQDHEYLSRLLKDKPDLLDIMLDDERLFPIIRDDDNMIVKISPFILFTILLRQVQREFHRQLTYMQSVSNRDNTYLFQLAEVKRTLSNGDVCAYMAHMLSTFTKVECPAIASKTRGVNYQRHLVDLDFDEILELVTLVELPYRFSFYKRLGDIALFICGIFPEYLHSDQVFDDRVPARLAGHRQRTLRDLEQEGRRFYDLASTYDDAQEQQQNRVLALMADKFPMVCKPLNYLVENYISRYRTRWFA